MLDEGQHPLEAFEPLGRSQTQRFRDERGIDARPDARQDPFVPRQLALLHAERIP